MSQHDTAQQYTAQQEVEQQEATFTSDDEASEDMVDTLGRKKAAKPALSEMTELPINHEPTLEQMAYLTTTQYYQFGKNLYVRATRIWRPRGYYSKSIRYWCPYCPLKKRSRPYHTHGVSVDEEKMGQPRWQERVSHCSRNPNVKEIRIAVIDVEDKKTGRPKKDAVNIQ
jgi:hypothetical protein